MNRIPRKTLWAALLACAATLAAPTVGASNIEECAQAAEFIGNAARARDAGMPREDFLAHMESDLEVIRSFPPEMRWFAETEADEQFLLNAARDVFDHPAAPEKHATRFARACVTRVDV